MDNICKNATRKLHTHDAAVMSTLTAPVRTTETITLHQKPVTATTAPHWCDPETVTLKQIDEHSRSFCESGQNKMAFHSQGKY